MRLRWIPTWTLACLLVLASLAGAQLRPQAIPLQTAVATATANGTAVPTLGYDAVGVQVVIASAWDGVINLETTTDGTNWVAVMCRNTATNATQTTVVAANALVVCPVTGTQSFRARISGRTTGTVTVTAALAGMNTGVMGGLGSGTTQSVKIDQTTPGTTNLVDTQARPQDSACKTMTVNAAGVANAGVVIDNTAGGVSVLSASTTRCGAVISALQGGGDMLCGPTTITVSSTVGFYIPAGVSLVLGLESQQAWKCIRQAGTNATAYVAESTP